MAYREKWRLAVTGFTLVAYFGSLVVTLYFTFSGESSGFGTDADRYATKILPASWVFAVIWGGIYLYSAVWLIYAATTLCRRGTPSSYLYYDPPYLSPVSYIAFAVVSVLGAVWLFVAANEELVAGLVVITLMWMAAIVAFFSAVFTLDRHKATLKQYGKSSEIGWSIALVLNGLGMYLTWLTIATLQNLSIVMIFDWGVDMDTTCYVSLSILLVIVLIWFVLDNFVWFDKTKYIFTPYIVLHVALGGIIDRNQEYGLGEDPVNVYVIALLCIGAFSLVFKIVYIFVKSNRNGDKSIPQGMLSYQAPSHSGLHFPVPVLTRPVEGERLTSPQNYGVTVYQPHLTPSYIPGPICLQQSSPVNFPQNTLQPLVVMENIPVTSLSQPPSVLPHRCGPTVLENTPYGLSPLQQVNFSDFYRNGIPTQPTSVYAVRSQ